MDDRFLDQGRREPRPEFARSLRERLRSQEGPAAGERPSGAFRLSPAVTAFAALLVVAGLFSIPAVRASAQAFLDLFRVRNFAAVTVDAARLEQLRGQKFDVESILGKPETVLDPGPLRRFASAQEAALATGYPLRTAVDAPAGFAAESTWVRGESRERLHVDATRLRGLLTALAIDDVQVPPAIDGAEVNVHVLPVAHTTYRRDAGHEIMLVQAPSPELSLPPGIDVAQLGEIGLRIAGLSAGEARRFAQNVDWHSTLLVPVPSDASSFREVEVRGNKGLLVAIGGNGERRDGPHRRMRGGSQILWSDGERVFAVVSENVSDVELLQMANAVQ
jgi:hypothetical protein